MNRALLMDENLKIGNVPVDLNTAAVTGARIKLSHGERLAIILVLGASTAAVVELTLKQHNAASSGTSKALSVMNPYFKKAGVATSFTKVEPVAAASVYDLSTDFNADSGIIVLEVLPEDLDVNGGFTHVSCDIADSTAAKIGALFYAVVDSKIKPAYEVAL